MRRRCASGRCARLWITHMCAHTQTLSPWPLCPPLDHTHVCSHTNPLTLATVSISGSTMYAHISISGSHCVHILTLATVPISISCVCVYTYKHSHFEHCVHLDHTCVCTHTLSSWLLCPSLDHTCARTYKHSNSSVSAGSGTHAGLTALCSHMPPQSHGTCTPPPPAQSG